MIKFFRAWLLFRVGDSNQLHFFIQHPSTKLRKKLQELVEYAKSLRNMLNNNKNWENMLKKLAYICDVTNNISYFEFIGKMFKRRKVFIVLPFSCRPIFLVDYIFQFQENCLLCYRIIEQIECKKILVVEAANITILQTSTCLKSAIEKSTKTCKM